MPPHEPVVCNYMVDELHRKFREKFPNRMVEPESSETDPRIISVNDFMSRS